MIAESALDLPARQGTDYPPPHDAPCLNRIRRALGDAFGLSQFGVNLLDLPPGTWSSQRHWHERQDEFVYVLEGEVVLVTDEGESLRECYEGWAREVSSDRDATRGPGWRRGWVSANLRLPFAELHRSWQTFRMACAAHCPRHTASSASWVRAAWPRFTSRTTSSIDGLSR
jgi:hypothetical protein